MRDIYLNTSKHCRSLSLSAQLFPSLMVKQLDDFNLFCASDVEDAVHLRPINARLYFGRRPFPKLLPTVVGFDPKRQRPILQDLELWRWVIFEDRFPKCFIKLP